MSAPDTRRFHGRSIAALLVLLCPGSARATWSIVAVDPRTREVGVAGASCVRGVVRIAGLAPGMGAVASQAASNTAGRDLATDRLAEGATPATILEEITSASFDTNVRRRQYGIAAFSGPPTSYTGPGTSGWSGHLSGANVAVQGNLLVGEQVVAASLAAFNAPPGACPSLADRLMAALEAGAGQGGDARCAFEKAAVSAFIQVAGPADVQPGLALEVVFASPDPTNPVTALRQRYEAMGGGQAVCADAGVPLAVDAGPDLRPDAREKPAVTRPVAGGCALARGSRDGVPGLALLLAGLLIGCARSFRSRWRRLTTMVVVGLALAGCSLRDLDALSAGVGPADAGFEVTTADTGGIPGVVPDAAPAVKALFWVDSGNEGVWTSGNDGTGRRQLVKLPAASFLRSVAVDRVARKVYFSDSGLKKIQRVNLDGSGLEDVVTGLDAPVGLDVDGPGGKLYFADQGAMPTIFRANLDGSAREPIITAGIMHPYGLVVDRANARLYFVDNDTDGVFRAGLDGKQVERLPITGLVAPIEIALDTQAGKLYWSDLGPPPRVRRANLDGSGAEDVITPARLPGFSTPLGVAVDVGARKLYFVDGGTGTADAIRRAELDGTGVGPVVFEGLAEPRGLAIGD